MAVRVRSDGRVLCAATHAEEPGDAYLDDGVHYELSVTRRVLVTERMDMPEGEGRGGHARHGEWWWRGHVPADVTVDAFYET